MQGILYQIHRDNLFGEDALERWAGTANAVPVSEFEHEYITKLNWKEINELRDDGINVLVVTNRIIVGAYRVYFIM